MKETIPKIMQAVELDEPNGDLSVQHVPVPAPKSGEVLVRMRAAPINPSDLGSLTNSHAYGERIYPFIPGIEGSGRVVGAGKGALPKILKGRRVACASTIPNGGTWAEFMVTSARRCVPLRKNIRYEQGAMLLVNPLSALAIFDQVKSGKHRAIVSTAAASALGGMILKLGKRFHIPVIHIVRRQEQVEMVRNRGAKHVLNSSDNDFIDQLREISHQLEATYFLDAIGGEMTQQLAESAPYKSTIVLYSNLSLQSSVINPITALAKHLRFEGWFLSNWTKEKNPLQALLLARQAQLLLDKDLHTPIYKTYQLDDIQQALTEYIHNMSAGKILLKMTP